MPGKKTVVLGSMSEIRSNIPRQLVNCIAPGLDEFVYKPTPYLPFYF